jgi:hypothetical protein
MTKCPHVVTFGGGRLPLATIPFARGDSMCPVEWTHCYAGRYSGPGDGSCSRSELVSVDLRAQVSPAKAADCAQVSRRTWTARRRAREEARNHPSPGGEVVPGGRARAPHPSKFFNEKGDLTGRDLPRPFRPLSRRELSVSDPPARRRRHAGEACVLEQARERVEAVEPGSSVGSVRSARSRPAVENVFPFVRASGRSARVGRRRRQRRRARPGCSWTSARASR